MTAGTERALRVDWPEKARRLAERFPVSKLHPEVVRWLEESDWSGRVGIACSGGGDSVCLVLMLWAHFPDLRDRFRVLHFDHQLRGDASREDAEFVADVAAGLQLDFRLGRWVRDEGVRVNEGTAREARFAFIYGELPGEGKLVVLGHNRDDVVESQLMRLSRGSGVAGLAAPRPVHAFRDGRVHLRPLLELSGERIRRELGELAIPFREDSTNGEGSFYRNRLRLEILPRWQRLAPADVSVGAAASRALLQEDDEALEIWLRKSIEVPVPGEPYDLGPVAEKPRALLRRALREWTVAEGLDDRLGKAAFEQLLCAVEEGRALRMSAGPNVFLELSGERIVRKTRARLTLAPFRERWPLVDGGTIFLPGGGALRATVVSLDSATKDRILAGRVDERREAFVALREARLWVRHRLPGDKFHPLGAPGARKVQDLLVDKKIPEAERDSVPVVCVDGEVLWMPHFPPAESAKINAATKTVVQLTYSCVKAV